MTKKYILIAGVNGAGKSTLYQTLDQLHDMPRVNIDEIVREIGSWRNPRDQIRAGRIAVEKIKNYFAAGISFNQETTLCGKSILRNIQYAKQLGYSIELHYVGVESAETAKKRVRYRVAHGGHDIPDKDIERRFSESLDQLKKILPLCDLAILYDNTDSFRRFAVYERGERQMLSEEQPQWYKDLNC